MAASNSDRWVCDHCGLENYHRKWRCVHCSSDRGGAPEPPAPMSSPVRHAMGTEYQAGAANGAKRSVAYALPLPCFLAWLYLVWEFRKWDARWGALPVLLMALLAAGMMAWWLSEWYWYRNLARPTRWRLIAIPPLAFVICAAVGIYFTEPIEPGGAITRADNQAGGVRSAAVVDRRSPDYRYDYDRTRAVDFYVLSFLDFGGSAPDADLDEGCLILVIVLLVIASFFVPHFWVLSTLAMVTIMGMMAYREWRRARHAPALSLAA